MKIQLINSIRIACTRRLLTRSVYSMIKKECVNLFILGIKFRFYLLGKFYFMTINILE